MADVFAVRTVKRTDYFGGPKELGNVYFYKMPIGVTFDDEAAALECAAAEKLVTTAAMTFIRWETWGPTNQGQFENVMRETGSLTGVGGIATPAGAYKEACSLVVWPLPRSPLKNRRRWSRKFLRHGFGSSAPGSAVLEGSAPLSDTTRNYIKTSYADRVTEQGALGGILLCTADGTEPTGPPEVRPYLYTRDIG